MEDKEIKIGIKTEADAAPVVEYSEAYKQLEAQLEASKARLAELEEQSEEGGFGGEGLTEARNKVAELEKALKKEAKAAKKAATEAGKLDAATDGAAEAAEGHADALAEASDAAREGTATLKDLEEWLRKKEAAEEKSTAADREAAKQSEILKIRRAGQAQVLTTVGQKLGELSSKLKASGEEISKVDKDTGKMITQFAELGETASSVATSAAAGFAVGGPLGAAIGGLTGVVGKLFTTWVEGEKQVLEAEARHKASLDSLAQSFRDLGTASAQRDLGRFQSRLTREIRLLNEQNDAIKLNLELQAIRDASDEKVRDIERATEREAIQRDVRDVNISSTEGALQIAQIDLEGFKEQLLAPVRDFEVTVAGINERIAVSQDVQAKIVSAREELVSIVNTAQNALNEGAVVGDQELVRTLLESSNEYIRGVGERALKSGSKFEELVSAGEAVIEKIDTEFDSARKVTTDLFEARDKVLAKIDELEAGVAREFEARVGQKTAQVLDQIKTGTDDIFKPILPKIDEEIRESGVQLLAQGEETRERIKELATDTIDDAKQIGEFVKLLRKLRSAGVRNTEELIRITEQHVKDAQRNSSDIKNLFRVVKQLRGG